MNPERQTALSSLTATYTDSEGEPDSDVEMDTLNKDSQNSVESSSSSSEDKYSKEKNPPSKLVSYTAENFEEDSESDESPFLNNEVQDDSNDSKSVNNAQNPPLSPLSFHRSLFMLKRDEINLPPEPIGRCSKSLQEKISDLYSKKKQGMDMNASIQQKKNFRNPSIYEKLITYCNIDEKGTNYPPEIYDPHCWGEESFYEELAKRQKAEMDKREREKKERTKAMPMFSHVEFISGTVKKTPTDTSAADKSKRKSKWDVGITQISGNTLKPATLVTPTVLPVATGTKPTVISAFGTITKKQKQ